MLYISMIAIMPLYIQAITPTSIYKQVQTITDYPTSLGYISISAIRPGQIRYSQQNTDSKIAAALKKGWAKRLSDGTLEPQFNNNTSLVPLDQAVPVVVGPKSVGLVLVDGHHDTIASLQSGATTIPVKVVADLSTLSPSAFWQEAAKRNFIYPYDINAKRLKRLPAAWKWGKQGNLKNDPNRYFAAISARKCGKLDSPPQESTGADYPLWVKVGKDIPFIEFMISDVLSKAGLNYTSQMGDDFNQEPLKSFTEQARQVLLKNPIKGLRLVPNRTYFMEINNGDLCGYAP